MLSQGSALKPQYEESITHLFQLILAYVRCGRTEDAIDLANQSGCFTLAGLIDTRNALFETELTPTDINDDNFGFSDSRASFKYVARKTISKVNIRSTRLNLILNESFRLLTPVVWHNFSNAYGLRCQALFLHYYHMRIAQMIAFGLIWIVPLKRDSTSMLPKIRTESITMMMICLVVLPRFSRNCFE